MKTKKETKEYSKMLYALADEIRREEGCITESADEVEAAAERMDTLTIAIQVIKSKIYELIDVMDSAARTLDRDGDEWGIAEDLRSAISEVGDLHAA